MGKRINRRGAIGIGGAAAGSALVGTGVAAAGPQEEHAVQATTARDAGRRIARKYARVTRAAGGTWSSYISVTGDDGSAVPVVRERADQVVSAFSVNKIPVAVAVLDKIDRGLLTLADQVEVSSDIVIRDTDGIFWLDGGYPSQVTIGHAMAALLTVSDNTAVRLCGLVAPSAEINEILQAKGFEHTQVIPVANPNRFYLGNTTPRELHTLLRRLVAGELLSAASTEFLLTALRAPSAFTDGVRLRLDTNERLRTAAKAGWFNDGRNEAGVMFDEAGAPLATYAFFANGEFAGGTAVDDDFSANHPALRARTALGRTMFDAVSRLSPATVRRHQAPAYRPYNGG